MPYAVRWTRLSNEFMEATMQARCATFVLGVIAAVFVSGCVTLEVNYDYDREADFTRYATYGWIESDVSAADDNPPCTSG